MDAQSESCEPPPCDPQPSGKIRKAFKLFGKRKPGSSVASIFSMREKGDGGPKSPPSMSKTLDRLNEPTAPEAEAEQVDLDQEEESQQEDAPMEEFTSGNINSETTPTRQSISSLTSAKSLTFLNMLRKGRRGVAGERQTQTESQRPGRQRKGIKGLFGSVRWRGKEKDEEEAEPGPPLLASRSNSVEIIKESVPLTPRPTPRSVEEQQQEEKKQFPTPQEGQTSSEDSEKVSEATKQPTNERFSTLLGDIASILSFDSLTACGDIVADVEAEWVKASTRMDGPTTLKMNDSEKDNTSSSAISSRSKPIPSPTSTFSPTPTSKPSPTSATKPIPSPSTIKPISPLIKPAVSSASSPMTKSSPSMSSSPITPTPTTSPVAKPTPTPSAVSITQSTPLPTPITRTTPPSTSTQFIQTTPTPTPVSIAQFAQGTILSPTSKTTISPTKPARSPKSSPEIKPATIPPSSPTTTPMPKSISTSTHTPVSVSTPIYETSPPPTTPEPAAVTKTEPTPTPMIKPTQAPTHETKPTLSITNESKHATSTSANKYTPYPPPFGKSTPTPAATPRPKLITTFGLSTSRNTAPITKPETKQPTGQAPKSCQSTPQTDKSGTTSRKASVSEPPAPIAKSSSAVSSTPQSPVLKSPPCTAPPPILSRRVEEEDVRQEGIDTRDSVAAQSLNKAVKKGHTVKPTSLSKIPVSGGGRPTKQQHQEAQPNGDEEHSNLPTPVHEEESPFSLSRESSSKEALSDYSTESGAVTPTLSQSQEDILYGKLGLQASARHTASSTSLARESKIPIKHGSTATYHSVQGRAEAGRSKIPVSKMPVRRTSNKPAPAATAAVSRK
ncbi:APC membrane recruitment protein 2 [Xyrauchen texanus]|uniref:APC membrane recruitment protein 2 n=1 Tax=Xyrauchen texanus TaxID=154827 RepID=UPI002241D6E2|nr:APC membrane recruitment protein 2 [Xyrauchen texanus]